MDISEVTAPTQGTGTSVTLDIGSGDYRMVIAWFDVSSGSPGTPQVAGNNMTQAGSNSTWGGGGPKGSMWYYLPSGALTGSQTVTASGTGANNLTVMVIAGVNTTHPIANATNADSQSSPYNMNANISINGCWAFAGSNNTTGGTTYSGILSDNTFDVFSYSEGTVSTGSQNGTVTFTGGGTGGGNMMVVRPLPSETDVDFGDVNARQTSAIGTGPTVGNSNTIGIVFHFGDNTDTLSAITWGAASMTKITSVQTPGDRYVSVWYVIAPTSAATITCVGATVNSWFAFYYTGAKQTGQPDSFNSNTSSSSTTIAVSTTVVAPNSWTVMMQKDITGGLTYTTSVGVMRVNASGGGEAISDSNGVVGTGAQSTTLTSSSSTHGAIAISIAPVGSSLFQPRPPASIGNPMMY